MAVGPVAPDTAPSEAHLAIAGITLAFGANRALDDVHFTVPRGSVFGIVGPNGAGKTSLLNCVNGFYRPDAGEMLFEGARITGLRPYEIAARGIGRTFQNVELFRDATTLDNIMLGRHLHMRRGSLAAALHFGPGRKEEAQNRQEVERVIEFLGIGHLRKRSVADLPWGLQKLVEIGRALSTEPRLLLLDEPTSGMNREEKANVAEAIIRMKDEMGLTQVLIEHDMRFVSDLCDQVVVLEFGKVIALGTPEDIAQDPRVIEAYLGTGPVA